MNNSFIVQEAKSKLGTGYVAALLPYAIIYAVLLHIGLFCYFMFPWSLIITIPCLIGLFLFYAPMEYGMLIFYAKSYKLLTPSNVEFLDGFKKKSIVKAMFLHMLRFIYVFLLSLLLFVPGIIMSINYSQAMLILHNNSKINITDALEESGKIMKGHRVQYFKLQSRLIPWYILAILTAGIGFIFISPYKNMLKMVFYKRVIKGDTGFMPKTEEETAEAKTDKSKPQDELSEISPVVLQPDISKDKNTNSESGVNKKSKENNKLLNNKIAHPILEKYDEFDKSPEQIKLEQELSALIDTGEEGGNFVTAEPAEVIEQSGEVVGSDELENFSLDKSEIINEYEVMPMMADTEMPVIIETETPVIEVERLVMTDTETPAIIETEEPAVTVTDTVNTQNVTAPQGILPPQSSENTTAANTVTHDTTADTKTGRTRLEELLAKRQAMQKKD